MEPFREQFEAAGLRVAVRPYRTPEGDRFAGCLPDPAGKFDGHVLSGRHFALDLVGGTWTHVGRLDRINRPAAELVEHLRTCGVPNRWSEGEEESEGHAKSTAPSQAAIPLTDQHSGEPDVLDVANAAAVECGSDSSPPSPAADIPREIDSPFAEACRARGIEFLPFTQLDPDNGVRPARYRGFTWLKVHLLQGSLMIGTKIANGRSFTGYSIEAGLAAIDAELDAAKPRPREEPNALRFEVPPPALSNAPRFRARGPILLLGGRIAAGEILIQTQRNGARANLVSLGGRRVCDYPLVDLEPVA